MVVIGLITANRIDSPGNLPCGSVLLTALILSLLLASSGSGRLRQ